MKSELESKDHLKKPYEAPKLKKYGKVSDITKAGLLFHDDAQCNGAPGGVGSGQCS